MKRFAALAMTAAFAVGFFGPVASADCHPGSSRSNSDAVSVEILYADGDESGGYVGISGSEGYLEVTGSADDQSLQVHGESNSAGLNGSVGTDKQCVNP